MKPSDLKRCLGGAMMVAAIATFAGTASALDLSQSVVKAIKYDPTLQASNYARKAGAEKRNQATALYLPQITLGAGYERVWTRTTVDVPPGFPFQVLAPFASAGNVYGYNVTLVQPLYVAGVSVKATQFRNQAKLADIMNQRTRQNLIAQVAEAYFNVIVGEETLLDVRAQKAAVAEQLASAKARFKAGRANTTDVQDAQTSYDTTLAQEIAAENNLAEWRARYERSVGAPARKLLRLPDDFRPLPPVPDDMNAWIARATAGNLDMQTREIQQAIAAKNIDLYTLSSRPQLSLFASYADFRQSGDLSLLIAPDRSENTTVGVQLSIPIFSGGGIQSELREARATKRQADYEVQAAQADATLQVRKTFQDIQAGIRRIAALEQAVVAAKSSLDANELALKVGVKSTQDVLDAVTTYYQTLEQLSQARYQYLMSILGLELLTGKLDESGVARVNGELHRD